MTRKERFISELLNGINVIVQLTNENKSLHNLSDDQIRDKEFKLSMYLIHKYSIEIDEVEIKALIEDLHYSILNIILYTKTNEQHRYR